MPACLLPPRVLVKTAHYLVGEQHGVYRADRGREPNENKCKYYESCFEVCRSICLRKIFQC